MLSSLILYEAKTSKKTLPLLTNSSALGIIMLIQIIQSG